ncbi:MAG: alpha-E domain-containing protein [Mycobacteriales bacterium]
MLSRVAEALYWTGRYVERAEDTSRLLDVQLQALLEDPYRDEAAVCRQLLRTMGIDELAEPDLLTTTHRLAFARTDTSSIAGALVGARENARGVRETLSSEVWECLNATFHELAQHERASVRLGSARFLRYVRERAATLGGLIEGTMPRDDGWHFLILGRSLERVDMTSRLLSVASHGSSASWIALLKSCSAYEAYLRTYRATPERTRVLEFLLLDRLFPRSVFAALTQAEVALAALEPTSGRVGVQDDARRQLGRIRTDLEFSAPAELVGSLGELLLDLQTTCSVISEALAAKHFAAVSTGGWAVEAG